MVSLAEIRARNVQPVWQEAVAVVQELIQSSTATGTPLPDLEHVALIPNGDVVAMPGSPEPPDPVRQAATMLRVLVDGTATPPELEEFVRKNLSAAAAPTLEDFSRGLSFYERPGRRSDVERLVSRAAAAEQMTRADVELRKLKEKATEASDSRLEDTVFMDTVAMSGRRRQPVAAIAGVALLVVVVGGAWWWWRNRTNAPQRSASAATSTSAAATSNPPAAASTSAAGAATVDKTPDKSASTGGSSAGASAPQSPAAASVTGAKGAGGASGAQGASAGAPSAGAPAVTAAGTAASNTTHPVTSTPGTAPNAPAPNAPVAPSAPNAPAATGSLYDRAKAAVQSAVNSIVGPAPAPEHAATSPPPPAPVAPKKTHHKRPLPVPPPVPPGTPVAVAVDVPAPVVSSTAAAPQYDALPVAHDDMIYTTTDAAVIPPVLVRPVLPKYPPPGLAEDQIGSIEVLVDEQGDVDQVRLISPANRFHERMLVSAAKTWKFRPAFKDGHPVRYRTRIRVTL